MRATKASFGKDQNNIGLVLYTDWVTGQIRSPGYHGNQARTQKHTIQKTDNFATPEKWTSTIKIP